LGPYLHRGNTKNEHLHIEIPQLYRYLFKYVWNSKALKRGSGSNGRELTADNCEVCAVEETAEKVEAAKIEQEERVEAIKATEDVRIVLHQYCIVF
jgi:hypothetical protein